MKTTTGKKAEPDNSERNQGKTWNWTLIDLKENRGGHFF